MQGRKRLEAALSSPALSIKDNVYRLVYSQLAAAAASSPSSSSFHTDTNNDRNIAHETVQSRFIHVWNLLELLRSASGEENHNLALTEEDDIPIEGWKLKHDTGQLRVMYRKGPKGTPYHTLLAEGFVNSPITSALCLALDAPSYSLWWPQMTVPMFQIMESRWIKRGLNGEDLSLIRVKVPWPLAAREVLMCAFEMEVFEEELIIVLLHSLRDTEDPLHGLKSSDIPGASSQVVRMELAGGFALQQLSSEQSYFRTVANLDIKLDFVPPWIINFISRQLIGLGFKLYEKTLMSINKEGSSGHFQKLIETEPMYDRIRRGLEAKKAESDVSEATEASKLEGIGSSVNKVVSSSSGEAAPAGGLSAKDVPSSSVEERSCDAAVGVDPEVRKALDVLDKVISLVQSRKVGSMNNNVLMPYHNDDTGSSHGLLKHSVHTQCSDIAHNDNDVVCNDVAPVEQVLDRTQEHNVTTQTSQSRTIYKWFCFKSSAL